MGKPDIIYEDNDIIVCCKPAGIATQTRRIGQQDMESFIRNYRAAKNEPPYVGIVHRLDQPVEGVMEFAKNQNIIVRQAEGRECQEQISKKIIMTRHGILLQIISHSTSVPIHLKSQAKKTSWQKKQCFSTG